MGCGTKSEFTMGRSSTCACTSRVSFPGTGITSAGNLTCRLHIQGYVFVLLLKRETKGDYMATVETDRIFQFLIYQMESEAAEYVSICPQLRTKYLAVTIQLLFIFSRLSPLLIFQTESCVHNRILGWSRFGLKSITG